MPAGQEGAPNAVGDAAGAVTPAAARPQLDDRIVGCLLGGALGDALGAPVEFMLLPKIRETYGRSGIRKLEPAHGPPGAFTDDTQMTLFTAEGLLREVVRRGEGHPPALAASLHGAYLRWLVTQGKEPPDAPAFARDGWLLGLAGLHDRRGPGHTCLNALRATVRLGEPARNSSKGCGGVMRAAPSGFLAQLAGDEPYPAFAIGALGAGLTHGHPTGRLAAGHLAETIAALAAGASLDEALDRAEQALRAHPGHGEVAQCVGDARKLRPARQVPGVLGEGWVAEEALAIAVWCVRTASDPVAALRLAVNHDGDSDSTGGIAGQLLGAWLGTGWLPRAWLRQLELRDQIETIGRDLAVAATQAHGEAMGRLRERYPPTQ